MTMTTINTAKCSSTAALPGKSLLSLVRLALAARHQRATLRHLDDAALCDLGLTRKQARKEASLPLWNVPANWLR